jgi:DNA-binding NarL/FixJ family response regulator
MIVDDFADTRESIGKLLYFEKDIEVVASVGDGQKAIQTAKEIHPHVILMDINMPGTDGIAATEGIASVAPECEVIHGIIYSTPINPAKPSSTFQYHFTDSHSCAPSSTRAVPPAQPASTPQFLMEYVEY